ncbi:MAG: YcjX family protein [Hyphomicrobiaceae bacterium]|nr:YcjX family protein [Hyphomicrobiaceae bacterium]
MPSLDFTRSSLSRLMDVGGSLSELATPALRLGVTGLARAGKTVFITALVRNLVREARLPFFSAAAEGRIQRAYLEPQPDDEIPRFAYEDHLAALASDPPEWPESTRRISELRVTVEYRSNHPIWRQLGPRRLHIDIVDYPGEWLIDLALLQQSFGEWSAAALAAARMPGRTPAARELLSYVATLDPRAPRDEQKALEGARIYTAYLHAERRSGAFEPTLGPGRFFLPGDLDGSPLLTFLPINPGEGKPPRGSLGELMESRYQSYVKKVVQPFFRDHFARLDRQIVLVDALSAIDRGGPALSDLETTLATVLSCFRIGSHGLLSAVLPRRIDRILLAATKADHVPAGSHDRLEAILTGLTARAADRAHLRGAETRALALASLRSTREAEIKRGPPRPVIVGVPLPGARIGGETFDGRREVAIFPGDLPASLEAALALPGPSTGLTAREKKVALVGFRPQRVPPDSGIGAAAPWPHIRLDRALEFLLGDRLA